jgi:hypothetical protein
VAVSTFGLVACGGGSSTSTTTKIEHALSAALPGDGQWESFITVPGPGGTYTSQAFLTTDGRMPFILVVAPNHEQAVAGEQRLVSSLGNSNDTAFVDGSVIVVFDSATASPAEVKAIDTIAPTGVGSTR